MKLSNKTLTKLYKGACYFEFENGYLCAYRYSKTQIDHMSKEGYDTYWLNRALISGPQRIELVTDATEISFDYKASEPHVNANTIDLYVNGVLSSVYKIENNLKGKVEFKMNEGKKTVSIYLPCESTLKVKNFTINGSYKSVKTKGPRVLILGDSITQGAGPSIASLSYANGLSRELGYNILAQGIGGYRFEPDDLMTVEGFDPDKIIIALGTNWFNVTSYDYESYARAYYKKINEVFGKKPVLVITPLWKSNVEPQDWERFYWCIDVIKDECKKYDNFTIVDGFELIPNVDECFSDKVHPNAFGSIYLTNNLVKAIKKTKF